MKVYALPDNVYKVMKWLAALGLPALATLISAIGVALNSGADSWQIAAMIITAVATFCGACIGYSAITAKEADYAED